MTVSKKLVLSFVLVQPGKLSALSGKPDKAVRIIPLSGNIYGEKDFENIGTFAGSNRNYAQ